MQLLAVSLLVGASAFVAPRTCSQRTVRVAQGETGEDVVAAAVEAVVAVEEPAFVEPLVKEPASFEPIVHEVHQEGLQDLGRSRSRVGSTSPVKHQSKKCSYR